MSSNSYNVYANPNMEIINPSDNVLDLGIVMSSRALERKKNVLGARPFAGPPAPPFPTLVIYVDDSFALYMYL